MSKRIVARANWRTTGELEKLVRHIDEVTLGPSTLELLDHLPTLECQDRRHGPDAELTRCRWRLMRIANIILAAPDLDYEVVLQRVAAEFVEAGVGLATIYTSPADKAIRISEWLYGSVARIGHLETSIVKSKLTEEQMSAIMDNSSLQLIEFRGKTDKHGHNYFSSSAAVSSDLIMLINTGAEAGSPERPLVQEGAIYWVINDGYPFIDSTAD